MHYTILQGVANKKDRFKVHHKYRYDSYEEVMKVFNEIKDNCSRYDLKKNECVLTVVYDNKGEPLELYRCYKIKKRFEL